MMAANLAQVHFSRPRITREEATRGKEIYWAFRRVQDVTLSILALAVLIVPMLIIGLLIVIDSPGAGPIFVHTRMGKDGKPFRFYKFRTMVPDAEERLKDLLDQNEMEGHAFKIEDDPRITRMGRFLRKSSIDELPQLINVIRGEMSIVGPRPPLPNEYAEYNDYERQRLYITPGLTCYWQIQPNRNDIPFEDWVALDVQYIKERSFLTDWKLIFKTFPVMLTLQGR
jgi:lipopolysaccharide/colanic/teichoic acid biosynthesis glycosyltransferase